LKVTELQEIFIVRSGNGFDANKMNFVESGNIDFISRDSEYNGFIGKVAKYNDVEPFKDGLITVALGGSFLLSSFVQPRKFYTAQNVAVLTPRKEMTLGEKLYYCKCISMNRFKYSAFGREANKTLKLLKVPEKSPTWIEEHAIKTESDLKKPCLEQAISLTNIKLHSFLFSQLFKVRKGKRIVVSKTAQEGKCPFVSAISKNNGVSNYFDLEPNAKGNTITVCYTGTYIGEAYYQPCDYWGTDNVNILEPRFDLNPYIAMFLITLIKKESFRFNYGRTWNKGRMEKSLLKLPITEDDKPDWKFIEVFIKSLNYSGSLA
jgi:hypothetical protein